MVVTVFVRDSRIISITSSNSDGKVDDAVTKAVHSNPIETVGPAVLNQPTSTSVSAIVYQSPSYRLPLSRACTVGFEAIDLYRDSARVTELLSAFMSNDECEDVLADKQRRTVRSVLAFSTLAATIAIVAIGSFLSCGAIGAAAVVTPIVGLIVYRRVRRRRLVLTPCGLEINGIRYSKSKSDGITPGVGKAILVVASAALGWRIRLVAGAVNETATIAAPETALLLAVWRNS